MSEDYSKPECSGIGAGDTNIGIYAEHRAKRLTRLQKILEECQAEVDDLKLPISGIRIDEALDALAYERVQA